MSAAIKTSLLSLEQSISKLDAALEMAAMSRKGGGQRDMFGMLTKGGGAANGNGSVDAKLLATRLDSAINKVEKILREG